MGCVTWICLFIDWDWNSSHYWYFLHKWSDYWYFSLNFNSVKFGYLNVMHIVLLIVFLNDWLSHYFFSRNTYYLGLIHLIDFSFICNWFQFDFSIFSSSDLKIYFLLLYYWLYISFLDYFFARYFYLLNSFRFSYNCLSGDGTQIDQVFFFRDELNFFFLVYYFSLYNWLKQYFSVWGIEVFNNNFVAGLERFGLFRIFKFLTWKLVYINSLLKNVFNWLHIFLSIS